MKKIFFISAIFLTAGIYGQGTFKITAGAIVAGSAGQITLENMHLDNDGSIYAVVGPRFRFSGNMNTNISGANNTGFFSIVIAKSGALVRLMRDINFIRSSISFESGLLDLNNHNIQLDHAANLIGESESSRIIGPTGGYVQIYGYVFANVSEDPGQLGAVFTSTQSLPAFQIRRGHLPQTGNLGIGTSISRYYEIIPCCGSLNYPTTFRFKYFDTELNGFNENNLVMWKSPNNIIWTNEGVTFRNTIDNYVEKIGVADLSGRWTLSSGYNARPVKSVQQQLTSLSAAVQNGKNRWKTWPNPANKILWMDITATGKSKAMTSLFDDKGALIRTQQDPLLPGSNLLHIDIKDLVAGIYFILTQWDDGQERRSAMFVKQ